MSTGTQAVLVAAILGITLLAPTPYRYVPAALLTLGAATCTVPATAPPVRGVWGARPWLAPYVLAAVTGIVFAVVLADPTGRVPLVVYGMIPVLTGPVLRRRAHVAVNGALVAFVAAALIVRVPGHDPMDVLSTVLALAVVTAVTTGLVDVVHVLLDESEREDLRARRDSHLLTTLTTGSRELFAPHRPDIVASALRTARQLGAEAVQILLPDEQGRLAEAGALPTDDDRRHELWALALDCWGTSPGGVTTEQRRGRRSTCWPLGSETDPAGLMVVRTAHEPDAMQRTVFGLLAQKAGRAVTLALHHERQAELLAETARLDRLKEDFVGSVSHELRTPLTVIRGIAETLHERHALLDEATVDELVASLAMHSGALDTNLQRLLTMVQIQGGTEPGRERVDVTAMAGRLRDRWIDRFATGALLVEAESGLVAVGSPTLVERAVEELLDNALRYNPPGTGTLLSCRSVGDHVLVSVVDAGSGMPSDVVMDAASPFVRDGEPLRRQHQRGLGLGLAMASRILELHGSSLALESSPYGTSASFELRRATGAPTPQRR